MQNSEEIFYQDYKKFMSEGFTKLLYFSENSGQIIEKTFHIQKEADIYILRGAVSRKKQLILALMEVFRYI